LIHACLPAAHLQVAADWWRSRVFVKTYRERRSWAAVFRAYYRVFAFHFTLYAFMQVQVSRRGRRPARHGRTRARARGGQDAPRC
jgi:hypothetical protein